MAVDVTDTTGCGVEASLAAAAQCLLALLHHDQAELSVALVDDARMRALNREWRGKDRPTDVLSFAQDCDVDDDPRPARARRKPAAVLGDVVVSVDTARRQAADGGWTLEEEINRLLLHGVLHLLGHEHEHGGEDARRMHAEEARLALALIAAGHPCAHETA